MPISILDMEKDPDELKRLLSGKVYREDAEAIAKLGKTDPGGADLRWREYVVGPHLKHHPELDARNAKLVCDKRGVLQGWTIGTLDTGVGFEARAVVEAS